MQQANAILSNGISVVPAPNEADQLSQDGYGSRSKSGNLVLSEVETLYLVERERLELVDERTRCAVSFEELFRRYSSFDEFLWNRYLIYKDMRGRGFVVRAVESSAVSFQVYERGGYPRGEPAYYLYSVFEGMSETIGHLGEILDSIPDNTSLKLAVIDRRGELVYYNLSDLDFGSLGSEMSD